MFFPPPGPALCKLGLARSAVCSVCSAWSLHSGPRTFLVLATAILDSFSLFYLPNFPPSRDGRPNSLGIGASRSFWLLPAELGQWGVLGLPLLLVSILRVLIAVSKGVWYIPWLAVVLYLCWTGTACCSWLTLTGGLESETGPRELSAEFVFHCPGFQQDGPSPELGFFAFCF